MLFFVIILAVVNKAASLCDNLVPEYCMLPFPNDFFRINIPGVGFRLNVTDTFPADDKGKVIDTAAGGWNDLHGFPVLPAITAYFEKLEDKDISECPRWWNMDRSLEVDSPTVLLDAETGERVAHWVELDHSSTAADKLRKHSFLMYPSTALEFNHRYIVAIRSLGSHSPASSSNAFKALRDRFANVPDEDKPTKERADHFEGIFNQLDAAGVKRNSLLLAWDFTTNDKTDVTSRMTFIRDDIKKRVGPRGPEYRVESVEYNTSALVAKKIKGKFMMPLYLNTHLPVVSARMILDENGTPVFNGYAWFDFEVIVPRGYENIPKSLGVMQYGHGLFGSYLEADNSEYLHQDAELFGYVICASNWIGLSHDDIPAAAEMLLTDLSNFPFIPDRLTQGVNNAHGLMEMLLGRFSQDPLMLTPSGESIIDTSKTAYFGNSCGGIMGTVYMATTQNVRRGLLGVAGGSFNLILPRSADFMIEFDILKVRYSDPVDRFNLILTLQLLWDRADPAAYMRSINMEPLDNTPTHQVIVHYGLGDAQVSWLGAHAIARSTNAVMYKSNSKNRNETFFGFEMLDDNQVVVGRSGIAGFDYKSPPVPIENVPADKAGDTHSDPRRDDRAQLQMGEFLLVGAIANTCRGTCVADTHPTSGPYGL